MYVMTIIEDHLGIEGRRATNQGKMVNGFIPPIEIHISWRWIVEYSINVYVVMEILSVVCALVHQTWGMKIMYTSAGE